MILKLQAWISCALQEWVNRLYNRRKSKVIPILTNHCNHTSSKYSFPETYMSINPPDYTLLLTYGVFSWFCCIIFPYFHHTGSISLSKPKATYSLSATSRTWLFLFSHENGRLSWPSVSDCLSVSQESQDPCAQQTCQHPIRGTIPWTVSLNWRAVRLTCSGRHWQHKEAPQWVFLLYDPSVGLPTLFYNVTCSQHLPVSVKGSYQQFTLSINGELWQVKTWGLPEALPKCEN